MRGKKLKKARQARREVAEARQAPMLRISNRTRSFDGIGIYAVRSVLSPHLQPGTRPHIMTPATVFRGIEGIT